jgi:hypothetical protein
MLHMQYPNFTGFQPPTMAFSTLILGTKVPQSLFHKHYIKNHLRKIQLLADYHHQHELYHKVDLLRSVCHQILSHSWKMPIQKTLKLAVCFLSILDVMWTLLSTVETCVKHQIHISDKKIHIQTGYVKTCFVTNGYMIGDGIRVYLMSDHSAQQIVIGTTTWLWQS